MHRIARTTPASILLLALIAYPTLLFRLGSLPLVGADEPRYARVAQEMSTSHRWVTPTLQGIPWLEKPPLYYWITIPIVRILGPTESAARLGSVLSAFLAALAVFALGKLLWGPEAGLAAAAVLLTSVGFAAFGRSASTDMPFTACLTIALALLMAAALGRAGAGLALLGWAFLGLAVLAKGPVALVLAAGIIAPFWCLRPGWRLRDVRPWKGAIVVAAVALPWFWLAFREYGFAFIAFFFINHNLARYVTDLHHHSQPAYYYVPVLLGLLYPWTGWLASLVPRRDFLRRLRTLPKQDPASFFLLLWIVVPVVFFSLSTSKLPGYVLPVLPPVALLLGRRIAAPARNEARVAWISLGISAAIGAALPLLGRTYRIGATGEVLLVAAVFLPAALACRSLLRSHWPAAAGIVVLQSAMLIVLLTIVGYPALALRDSTREIAHLALSSRTGAEPIVTYDYFHHTLQYYTGYQVAGDMTDGAMLRQFVSGHASVLVVTQESRIPEVSRSAEAGVSILGRQGTLALLRVSR